MALFVTMLVIGGLGTFAGPMVGTALITVVSEYLRDYQEARLIILGLILLVTVVVAPRGLVPVLQDARARVQRWMSEDEPSNDAETGTGSKTEETSELPVSSSKGER